MIVDFFRKLALSYFLPPLNPAKREIIEREIIEVVKPSDAWRVKFRASKWWVAASSKDIKRDSLSTILLMLLKFSVLSCFPLSKTVSNLFDWRVLLTEEYRAHLIECQIEWRGSATTWRSGLKVQFKSLGFLLSLVKGNLVYRLLNPFRPLKRPRL